mmetsp:Transcript_59421/g.125899  ORF Transcript_59421/g.125899 Transcript_59421/m.125899 type:complete len:222 (+) Transcript_59421:841-1506(+)
MLASPIWTRVGHMSKNSVQNQTERARILLGQIDEVALFVSGLLNSQCQQQRKPGGELHISRSDVKNAVLEQFPVKQSLGKSTQEVGRHHAPDYHVLHFLFVVLVRDPILRAHCHPALHHVRDSRVDLGVLRKGIDQGGALLDVVVHHVATCDHRDHRADDDAVHNGTDHHHAADVSDFSVCHGRHISEANCCEDRERKVHRLHPLIEGSGEPEGNFASSIN